MNKKNRKLKKKLRIKRFRIPLCLKSNKIHVPKKGKGKSKKLKHKKDYKTLIEE